jgi:hypothetical protein
MLKRFLLLVAWLRSGTTSRIRQLLGCRNENTESLMYSGYQSFTISVAGYSLLTLPSFAIAAADYPAVDHIAIESTDERYIVVKVFFRQVASPEDADSIGRLLAGQVADRLAFEYMIAATDPVKGDGSFERRDASGTVHAVVSNTLGLTTAGHVTKSIALSDVPQLKPQLETAPPRREPYLAQFRWIMCQDDPVARFMHLYKILLSLEGGPNATQSQVDTFITRQEPTVQTIFNPNPKVNRNETIYTRLRNEVGHEIPGTTPASTRQGMEQYVDKLAGHVKAAITNIT